MIVLLLACAATPTESAVPPDPVIPNEGDWAVVFSQTYEGDCKLADMSTGQPETSTWRVELEPVGFTLYDETGYPSGCSLETDGAFACPQGEYDIGYSEGGYDATEVISSTTEGTFLDATTMDAALEITAECDGTDCPAVGEQYGDEFEYPCTAVGRFTATWAG